MSDFDQRFKAAQRRGDWTFRFVFAFIAIVGVLMAVVIVMSVYELATLRPEDVGGWFGRLIHAFKSAA